MRTIGVLGGIGPQATTDFEMRVHAEARRLLKPHLNEGYRLMASLYLSGGGSDERPEGPFRG